MNLERMHPDAKAIYDHYQFEWLPVEGAFFKNTYQSSRRFEDNSPYGTGMIGMYCNDPLSVSCFHRLDHDELWHFYGGDPITLYLLFSDGRTNEIVLGPNPLLGHKVQTMVPAGVWQGGCLNDGGRYALFGCTMTPGFTGNCFEAGLADILIAQYPEKTEIIRKLSVNGENTHMPDDFMNP